jgi:hypothetical protein
MGPRSRAGLLTGIAACVALVATGSMAGGAGAASSGERKACGTYRSESVYDRAKVIALRGVTCRRARRVAIRFDHTGDHQIGRFRCALAHGDRPNLFSCGWPPRANLRHAPHALLARGIPNQRP